MKTVILITLLLFSFCRASDGFTNIIHSFKETSVPGDDVIEGWISTLSPIDEQTACGGTYTLILTNEQYTNTQMVFFSHTHVKIEYELYCLTNDESVAVNELFVDGNLIAQQFKTEVDNISLRTCDPFQSNGDFIKVCEVVEHTDHLVTVVVQSRPEDGRCFMWDFKLSFTNELDFRGCPGDTLPAPEPQECFDHLGTLMDGEGNIPMTNSCEPFVEEEEQRFKFTTMFLEPYEFNDECLDIDVWFNGNQLEEGEGNIDQWSFDEENQKIIWNLNLGDFVEKYQCEDGEMGSQLFWKCDFSVKILFDGEVQVEYNAKIQVVVDSYLENSLEVDVQKNVVEGVCCENELNVETELRFCTDMSCTAYEESPLSVVRKESFFVEQWIVNPEFQGFYLKFLEAQLGEFFPNVVKKDSSQPGKLILEIQSNVAKNDMVLSVISQLHKDAVEPHVGQGENRFLQEDRISQAQNSLNNNEYRVASYEQISVAYAYDLKSEGDLSSSSSQEKSDMGLGSGSGEKFEEDGIDYSSSDSTVFIVVLGGSLVLSFGLVFGLVKFYLKQRKEMKQSSSKYEESERANTEQDLKQNA